MAITNAIAATSIPTARGPTAICLCAAAFCFRAEVLAGVLPCEGFRDVALERFRAPAVFGRFEVAAVLEEPPRVVVETDFGLLVIY